MVQQLNTKLIPANITDYPIIQNMARFYVYDRSRDMGWECPASGLFECIDFKHYFESYKKKSFLVKINDELAGFVLLDKICLIETIDWNMGEFFILAKFQSKGVGSQIARKIFSLFPGKWSIAVMPENNDAVKFWNKIIKEVSGDKFTKVFKTASELMTLDNPDPYDMTIFQFKI